MRISNGLVEQKLFFFRFPFATCQKHISRTYKNRERDSGELMRKRSMNEGKLLQKKNRKRVKSVDYTKGNGRELVINASKLFKLNVVNFKRFPKFLFHCCFKLLQVSLLLSYLQISTYIFTLNTIFQVKILIDDVLIKFFSLCTHTYFRDELSNEVFAIHKIFDLKIYFLSCDQFSKRMTMTLHPFMNIQTLILH